MDAEAADDVAGDGSGNVVDGSGKVGGRRRGGSRVRRGAKLASAASKAAPWLAHGIAMGFVWFLQSFLMIATNRWYQHYWKYA